MRSLRRNDQARAQFECVLKLRPDHACAHNNLGNLLATVGRIDDAIPHFEYACALNPQLIDARKSLGTAFARQGRTDDAVRQYRLALAGHPDDAETHNELASLLKYQGKLEAASVHYGQAIAIKPSYAQPHYNRADIKTFHPGDPDLAALELLAKRQLPAGEAVFVHFALAKAFEDCGEFGRAFEHMRKGNNLKRRQIDYDEPAVDRFIRQISTVFSERMIERFKREGESSATPIFVVGMPRSGSTLVEQILSSHPGIHGAGELMDLDAAIQSVLSARGQRVRYPECVPDLDGATLRQIADAYTGLVRARVGGDLRIVDKLPANFAHIGLIHLILPNAKIIHTVRNPIDTCLSCYSKLFTAGQQFSYDLAELGRFFCRYAGLMAHWRSVLPPETILHVRYEDVVDDCEGQARRLLAYCGLPWDDRCLRFHENNRPVRTASAVQVRKPLFRSSLQRWRRYESGLAPLLQELKQILPGDAPVDTALNRLPPGGRARAATAG